MQERATWRPHRIDARGARRLAARSLFMELHADAQVESLDPGGPRDRSRTSVVRDVPVGATVVARAAVTTRLSADGAGPAGERHTLSEHGHPRRVRLGFPKPAPQSRRHGPTSIDSPKKPATSRTSSTRRAGFHGTGVSSCLRSSRHAAQWRFGSCAPRLPRSHRR